MIGSQLARSRARPNRLSPKCISYSRRRRAADGRQTELEQQPLEQVSAAERFDGACRFPSRPKAATFGLARIDSQKPNCASIEGRGEQVGVTCDALASCSEPAGSRRGEARPGESAFFSHSTLDSRLPTTLHIGPNQISLGPKRPNSASRFSQTSANSENARSGLVELDSWSATSFVLASRVICRFYWHVVAN